MDQSYEDFLKELKSVSGPRKHKVTKSSGMAAAFTFYRNNRPRGSEFVLARGQYDKIINDMNSLIIEELIANKSFLLPATLGRIRISKIATSTFIDASGKLVCTKPVNYDQTYRLWHSDDDARASKTLVRYDVDDIFRITHSSTRTRSCKNLSYFKISFSRGLKHIIKDEINNNNFDTYEQTKFHKH